MAFRYHNPLLIGSTYLPIKQSRIFILMLEMKNREGDSLPALRRMATSGLVLFGRFSRWVSSRIFDGYTRGFALSVLSVGFPNYENILCSYIYDESLLRREDNDCV